MKIWLYLFQLYVVRCAALRFAGNLFYLKLTTVSGMSFSTF